MTVRNSTGSSQEVVVSTSIREMNTTAITSIIFISLLTFSSMNLLVGAMPSIMHLSPRRSSISSMALWVSFEVSPPVKVISMQASPSL